MNKEKDFRTSIGGQAVIEGVMMRGPYTSALAVRQPDHEIHVETWETNKNHKKPWYKKVPLVRGCVNFVEMMILGYKTLMRSADIAGQSDDEELTGFDKWVMEKAGDKAMTVLSVCTLILSLTLAIGLFIILPTLVTSLLKKFIPYNFVLTLIEGVTKIGIFVGYLALVSRNKDIKRVFMYHGAEHKTIACYEAGEELTPENAKKYTRFHPRCGTSFLFLILAVSVLIFSVASWESALMRIVMKIVLLPLVVGISYEIIKLAGRYTNPLTKAVSAPGLWLQRLTTKEPDLEMLAVAIESIKPCIPDEEGADRW